MAPLTRDSVLSTLARHRERLTALGVQRLGLFGSHLRGTARPDSDLDFLVSFAKPTFDRYMDTKFLLEDLFERPVDLVTERSLKPALHHVRDEAAYVEGL